MSTAEQSAPVRTAGASIPVTRTEEPIMHGYEHALAQSRMREMRE